MGKNAIVAIGYNRVDSMLRLLNSLQMAQYGEDATTLIISIDNSGNSDVLDAVNEFEWKHGKKQIRTFSERQGLRKHILSCADFLEEYDALFVFEDDVIVSPFFYQYGKKCIEKYEDDENIAGISLYALQWNQNANLPFSPLKSQYDTYFVQYAQSWGQIWLKKSFLDFKNWYEENLHFFDKEDCEIPSRLYTWGNNSWLKFHIAYCIKKNKFFVYPYISYTTVFTEPGEHTDIQLTRFHSDLMLDKFEGDFKWAEFDNNAVCYDAFLENLKIKRILKEIWNKDVMIDLYGHRMVKGTQSYVLSSQILPFKVIKEYGLQLRPLEANILLDIQGTGLYLYDCSISQQRSVKKQKEQIVRKWNYFMRERFLLMDEIFPVCKQKFWNLMRITFLNRK